MNTLQTNPPTTRRNRPHCAGNQDQAKGRQQGRRVLVRRIRENALSLVLIALFLVFLVGMSIVGLHNYNEDQREHGEPPTTYLHYLTTGSFIESVGENWESEFLQMFAYVLLTVFLVQKGSSESKDPDREEAVDEDPRTKAG